MRLSSSTNLPGATHHVRLHALAAVRVRHADDRARVDGRVLEEHLLDLGRVHVEARHDDEVLHAVDEEEVPVVVDHGDVARAQPTVGGERARGCLGIVPVTGEHVRTLHPDLAGVADEDVVAVGVDEAHLHAGERQADRAGLGAGARRGGDHRRGLGEAVALGDRHAEDAAHIGPQSPARASPHPTRPREHWRRRRAWLRAARPTPSTSRARRARSSRRGG